MNRHHLLLLSSCVVALAVGGACATTSSQTKCDAAAPAEVVVAEPSADDPGDDVAWDEVQDADHVGTSAFATGMMGTEQAPIGNPDGSYCGSDKARGPFSSLDGWQGYLCRDASPEEPGCYPRHSYTGRRRAGCPGAQLCCQPERDCATTWECRELGWCTPVGDHCAASAEAMCQAATRCQAAGTCTYVADANGVGDCCTDATGAYCNVNELRFETSKAVERRVQRCRKPPAFQGARLGTAAFDVTGEAVSRGTTRSYGFGDAVLVSRSEGGSDVYVLHGLDVCGLWLKHEVAMPGVIEPQRLLAPSWVRLKPREDGHFDLRRSGAKIALTRSGPGVFDAELVSAIRQYDGE